jgi:hypothetical protein
MPYLTYGIEMWFASTKTIRSTLELLLRHCLRVVLNDVGIIPVLANVWLYTSLGILPLSLLFQQKLALLMFKVLKCGGCPAVKRILMRERNERGLQDGTLRVENPFSVPLTRQESCRARLPFYGCMLWNCLWTNLRNARTEASFVSVYQTYLMNIVMTDGKDTSALKFYEYV